MYENGGCAKKSRRRRSTGHLHPSYATDGYRSPGGPSSATLRVIARARVKSDTIPRSTSCSALHAAHHPPATDRVNSKGKHIGGSGRLRFLSFPFSLVSCTCCGSCFLSRTHYFTHHTLSLSLTTSVSLSHSSLDVRRVCVFDLVRYLHRFLSSRIAPGWGIRVFIGLPTANRQLCALSSPFDNSSLYSSRQPSTNTNPKNQNVLLRCIRRFGFGLRCLRRTTRCLLRPIGRRHNPHPDHRPDPRTQPRRILPIQLPDRKRNLSRRIRIPEEPRHRGRGTSCPRILPVHRPRRQRLPSGILRRR